RSPRRRRTNGTATVTESGRGVAVVTGASRRRGIAAAVIAELAADGWDIVFTHWAADGDETAAIAAAARAHGRRAADISLDLADLTGASELFRFSAHSVGPASALIICHTQCQPSDTLTTSAASFDEHYQINVRAVWLLIHAFASQF